MINIDPSLIFQQRLAVAMGLDKYSKIMKSVHHTDVSVDTEFQKTFNSFYKVRRNREWLSYYYGFLEKMKNTDVSFSNILLYLHEKTGRVEASFSSKLMSTINPDMPIWDQYVITNLNISLPKPNDPLRLEKTVHAYQSICSWYEEFLQRENAQRCITEFNRILPDYSWMTDVKKIDFFLWSIR